MGTKTLTSEMEDAHRYGLEAYGLEDIRGDCDKVRHDNSDRLGKTDRAVERERRVFWSRH